MVNNLDFISYKHRVDPNMIDMIDVYGDVQLVEVELQ